jgi:hypothetical protein
MSRGLSRRQRKVMAILDAAERSLDVTKQLLPALGLPASSVSRRSLLRAMRSLEQRGHVAITYEPDPRGGHPRVLASAQIGAVEHEGTSKIQRVVIAKEIFLPRAD